MVLRKVRNWAEDGHLPKSVKLNGLGRFVIWSVEHWGGNWMTAPQANGLCLLSVILMIVVFDFLAFEWLGIACLLKLIKNSKTHFEWKNWKCVLIVITALSGLNGCFFSSAAFISANEFFQANYQFLRVFCLLSVSLEFSWNIVVPN